MKDRGRIIETVKWSVLARDSRGRKEGEQVEWLFRAAELFCMILPWWAHIITRVLKPMGCTTLLNVNCGL